MEVSCLGSKAASLHAFPLAGLSQASAGSEVEAISDELCSELIALDPANAQRHLFVKVAVTAQAVLLHRALGLPQDPPGSSMLYRLERSCSHTEFSTTSEGSCYSCREGLRNRYGSCSPDVLIKLAIAEALCENKFPNPGVCTWAWGEEASLRLRLWERLESMVPCHSTAFIDALLETFDTKSIEHLSSVQKAFLRGVLSRYRFLYSVRTTALVYRKTLYKANVWSSLQRGKAISRIATILRSAMDFRDCLQKSLENLSDGESTIVPCSVDQHTILLEIRRQSSTYTAIVYNTGELANLHRLAQYAGQTHAYTFPKVYQNIQRSHLADLANEITAITTKILEQPGVEEGAASGIGQLYGILQKHGQEFMGDPCDQRLLAYKLQSFKSCQESCVQAWLRQHLSQQEHGFEAYREFKYNFLELLISSLGWDWHASVNSQAFLPDEQQFLCSIILSVLKKRLMKRAELLSSPSVEHAWPRFTVATST